MQGGAWAFEAPYQFPMPLEGRYWDGDFRCDGESSKPCRGFLEAIYGGGDEIIDAFRPYMLADRSGDPIVLLNQQTDQELLKRIHRSLVAFHKEALRKATFSDFHSRLMSNDVHYVHFHFLKTLKSLMKKKQVGKLELVNASLPDSAVLSSWTAEAAGFEAGCHSLKALR